MDRKKAQCDSKKDNKVPQKNTFTSPRIDESHYTMPPQDPHHLTGTRIHADCYRGPYVFQNIRRFEYNNVDLPHSFWPMHIETGRQFEAACFPTREPDPLHMCEKIIHAALIKHGRCLEMQAFLKFHLLIWRKWYVLEFSSVHTLPRPHKTYRHPWLKGVKLNSDFNCLFSSFAISKSHSP